MKIDKAVPFLSHIAREGQNRGIHPQALPKTSPTAVCLRAISRPVHQALSSSQGDIQLTEAAGSQSTITATCTVELVPWSHRGHPIVNHMSQLITNTKCSEKEVTTWQINLQPSR